jgi:hypothetical protein
MPGGVGGQRRKPLPTRLEKIRNSRTASEKRFDDQYYFQLGFNPVKDRIAPLVLWQILYYLLQSKYTSGAENTGGNSEPKSIEVEF